ncbi:hypothetical protein O181_106111 [Austropuccinia psidii MF-1]|uniref:Uncharacterized protein n=1 Tax=Austropuccinia psidii MF-1 TaxID=1389203 RepID=A0A9Q3JQT5_9BASI|nr:hypothetical protein [Austropuccinia psidii MF-1]
MASGNHQRPPDQLQARIPLQLRGRLPFLQCTLYSGPGVVQIWYNIPFLLSNTMVTLSGPKHVISNQVPNPSPSLKEDFSAIQSGDSLASTRRPFKDPNHLALQELGC